MKQKVLKLELYVEIPDLKKLMRRWLVHTAQPPQSHLVQ